jgi:N-acyl-D-amino-acid deacylase
LEDRQPLEVRYYSPGWGESVFAEDLGKRVPRQYGAWHLEAMDSHGAWIASAVDLARFACAFDRPSNSSILKKDSIKTMFERPTGLAGFDSKGQPNATYYSLGWMNRPTSAGKSNNWHTGSLSGTAALIVRRSDGRNFVALFNARSSRHTRHFGQEIDRHINPVIDRVKTWPSADLFDKFQ